MSISRLPMRLFDTRALALLELARHVDHIALLVDIFRPERFGLEQDPSFEAARGSGASRHGEAMTRLFRGQISAPRGEGRSGGTFVFHYCG